MVVSWSVITYIFVDRRIQKQITSRNMPVNCFSRIKPVLNKLSELNVYDSLYVVRAYMQIYADDKIKKTNIPGVEYSEANSIEVWFADFMIANIIKYCDDLPSSNSLRYVNTRHQICNKIQELHDELSKKQIHREVFIWLNSYFFNQAKITVQENELRVLYRYYFLYKTTKVRKYAEQKMGFQLELYFRMAFFVYAIFANKERFFAKDEYLMPPMMKRDELYGAALKYVLSQISNNLVDLKKLCKDYCNYDEDKIFGYYNDAPHVKYPLIKDNGGYFCVIPNYIPTALLDGLYYRLDIPNCGIPDINKELSENLENYLGLIFNHFLKGSKISFKKEIIYESGGIKNQKTSDWILWDKTDICFMDCKTKRISVKGKQSVVVDDEVIDRVVKERPFSSSKKKKEIDDSIPEGLTKDLIALGIGIGKILVSYDYYRAGKVCGFPYMEGKKFHAVIVTLEESFSNSPGYKERIIKIARSYRAFKTGNDIIIDTDMVKILSVRNIEECTCIIAKEGIGFYLDNHMDNSLIRKKWVNDKFLVNKCNEELINFFLEELKPYFEE